MKKATVILAIAALICLAPVAKAQNGAFSVGGMIGLDQKRLEIAPSVQFQMAAYTGEPPLEGFDSQDLVGFFSSATGMYPTLMTGMYAKVVVNPSGINTLEGIDFDPTGGMAKLNDKKGWVPLRRESKGGWSTSIYCDEPRPIVLCFRIRHRDGRDKYQFLIIVATWVRGGSLPAKLELTIQRWPYEAQGMTGETVFPYLNGFIPATAQAKGQVTSQQYTVPPQTATNTAGNGQLQANVGDPDVEMRSTVPPFGVEIRASYFAKEEKAKMLELKGEAEELTEPSIKTAKDTVSVLNLKSSEYGAVVFFESTEPFSGTVSAINGNELALKVEKVGRYYRAAVHGTTKQLIELEVKIVVRQNGQTRTIHLRSQGVPIV